MSLWDLEGVFVYISSVVLASKGGFRALERSLCGPFQCCRGCRVCGVVFGLGFVLEFVMVWTCVPICVFRHVGWFGPFVLCIDLV